MTGRGAAGPRTTPWGRERAPRCPTHAVDQANCGPRFEGMIEFAGTDRRRVHTHRWVMKSGRLMIRSAICPGPALRRRETRGRRNK